MTNISNINTSKIQNVINSIALLADIGDFDRLEKQFSSPVAVDYTALFDGEAETKTPQELMTAWANLLPGFDATQHCIRDIQVTFSKQNQAIATAQFTATHYLHDQQWRVSGEYQFVLKQQDTQWQVSTMTVVNPHETGTRDILAAAVQRATENPCAYLQRQQTQQTVLDFLQSLERKDMDAFANVWADDAIQDMPYSPEGFPKQLNGKAQLVQHYSGWPNNSGHANFTKGITFYPMNDPQAVFVEYHGDVDVIPTGRKYIQDYGGLFQVKNGKITFFREYFNPVPFSYAFGLDEPDRQF